MVSPNATLTTPAHASPKLTQAQTEAQTTLKVISIKGLSGVIVWRDLTLLRRFTSLLSSYLPPSPRFQESLKGLRALRLSTWSPVEAHAEGLELTRGLALSLGGAHTQAQSTQAQGLTWRVSAAHQAGREREALLELRALLSLALSERELDALTCQTAQDELGERLEGWLTCDQGAQSAPPPSWLRPQLNKGSLWAYMPKPNLSALLQRLIPLHDEAFSLGLPSGLSLGLSPAWTGAELHLELEGDELSMSLELAAPFHPLFQLFNTSSEPSEALAWVHPSSPLTFSLTLNHEQLKLYQEVFPQHPLSAALGAWGEAGWRGASLLTFDGGLDHPVLMLELNGGPWSAHRLATLIASSLGAELGTQDEQGLWAITLGEGAERWTLPIAQTSRYLMVGLFSVDLKRRLSGLFPPLAAEHLRPLSEPGVSGLFVDFAALKPSQRLIDLTLLPPVLVKVMTGRSAELVDIPYGEHQPPLELASALARLSEVRRDPLMVWLGAHPKLNTAQGERSLKALVALHEFISMAIEATEGLTVTMRSYLDVRSSLRFEARWRLL